MSITPDPACKNSWIVATGERQYDYEGYLGIVESGRLGHSDNPSMNHDQFNEACRMDGLKSGRPYNWLKGQEIAFTVDLNILNIGHGNTARITIGDDEDAKLFDEWLNT